MTPPPISAGLSVPNAFKDIRFGRRSSQVETTKLAARRDLKARAGLALEQFSNYYEAF